MTDRFPSSEPQTVTFRADLPHRRTMSRRWRFLIVGGVTGVLLTILVFAWIELAWLSGLPKVPAARKAFGT